MDWTLDEHQSNLSILVNWRERRPQTSNQLSALPTSTDPSVADGRRGKAQTRSMASPSIPLSLPELAEMCRRYFEDLEGTPPPSVEQPVDIPEHLPNGRPNPRWREFAEDFIKRTGHYPTSWENVESTSLGGVNRLIDTDPKTGLPKIDPRTNQVRWRVVTPRTRFGQDAVLRFWNLRESSLLSIGLWLSIRRRMAAGKNVPREFRDNLTRLYILSRELEVWFGLVEPDLRDSRDLNRLIDRLQAKRWNPGLLTRFSIGNVPSGILGRTGTTFEVSDRDWFQLTQVLWGGPHAARCLPPPHAIVFYHVTDDNDVNWSLPKLVRIPCPLHVAQWEAGDETSNCRYKCVATFELDTVQENQLFAFRFEKERFALIGRLRGLMTKSQGRKPLSTDDEVVRAAVTHFRQDSSTARGQRKTLKEVQLDLENQFGKDCTPSLKTLYRWRRRFVPAAALPRLL
jgi:hypothetical protein